MASGRTAEAKPRPDIHVRGGVLLMTPQDRPANSLRVGQWAKVAGQPHRIADLRQCGTGRVVHLEGGRRPLVLGLNGALAVYTATQVSGRVVR